MENRIVGLIPVKGNFERVKKEYKKVWEVIFSYIN